MSDLALLATVTRSNLDPDPGVLDLDDGVNFSMGRSLDIGAITWEKTTVASPYIHGRFVTNERMAAAEGALEIYCLGNTNAACEDNLGTLLEAFTQQHEYVLRLVVNGVDHEWLCERADYEVGFITETLAARILPVRLSFYRNPVPVTGVF